MDTRYAQTIIKIAKSEAAPPPYGQVNDFYPYPGQSAWRFGWERLKRYFEEGANYTNWNFKGKYKDEEITALDGVRLKNKRVPQPNRQPDGSTTWSGTQWCGIFAAWCWKQAKVPGAYWAFPGVKAAHVKLGSGSRRIKKDDVIMSDLGLGDIAVMKDKDPKNRLVHHCVVTDFRGNKVEVVNGNSDYQGITVKEVPRTDIEYFYTVKTPLLEILNDLYGPNSEIGTKMSAETLNAMYGWNAAKGEPE